MPEYYLKPMAYHEPVHDDSWQWPKMHGYQMKCCDCGLVHEMDFAVVNAETGEILNGCAVIFRAYRVDKQPRPLA